MVSYRVRAAAFGIIGALSMAACVVAADWPQFLGPQRRRRRSRREGPGARLAGGRAEDSLGAAGRPRLRRRGRSTATACCCSTARTIKADPLRRFKMADGKEVWHYTYAAPGGIDHNGSRSTPATDGDMVFGIGPFGQISGQVQRRKPRSGKRTCSRTGARKSRSGRSPRRRSCTATT